MAEVPALAAVVLLAVGALVLAAVLDAALAGVPLGRAVAAPLAEGARWIRRRRPPTRPVSTLPTLALLATAVLRLLLLPLAGAPPVDVPLGMGGLAAAQLLALPAGRSEARVPTGVAALLALAAPAVAAGSGRVLDVVAAQSALPFAAVMPVAAVVLAVAAVPGDGAGAAAGSLALVTGAATAVVLAVGTVDGPWRIGLTAVLVGVIVAARALLPRPRRPRTLAWVALAIASIQLGTVVLLAATAGFR